MATERVRCWVRSLCVRVYRRVLSGSAIRLQVSSAKETETRSGSNLSRRITASASTRVPSPLCLRR